MDYDTQYLYRMGRKFRDLRAGIDNLRAELAAEIRAASAAGVPQVEIVRLTGYTRDQIRLIVKGRTR